MKLCILLLTYERLIYAERTLRSALDKIVWSEPISVHIADDGSSENYRQKLHDIAGGYDKVQGVSITNSDCGGYGMNYNLALQVIHQFADLILPLEDDWELNSELDLRPLAAALENEEYGCIRMGYLGFTQQLRGEVIHVSGHTYFRPDHDTPEPHVWAGHPRLETREWQRSVGPWPEGYDPGTTEFIVAQRPNARVGVLWPLDLVKPYGDLWSHIGTIQARTDQREAILS